MLLFWKKASERVYGNRITRMAVAKGGVVFSRKQGNGIQEGHRKRKRNLQNIDL